MKPQIHMHSPLPMIEIREGKSIEWEKNKAKYTLHYHSGSFLDFIITHIASEW